MEAIESSLYGVLVTERKVDFLPYANHFLGFIVPYVSDINFQVSLTSLKILAKLL